MDMGRMTNMWIANLNLLQYILFVTAGYIIGFITVSVIILFIADVINVIKRRMKK